jgi:hypothetical protein
MLEERSIRQEWVVKCVNEPERIITGSQKGLSTFDKKYDQTDHDVLSKV